jgi:hypothetical protein
VVPPDPSTETARAAANSCAGPGAAAPANSARFRAAAAAAMTRSGPSRNRSATASTGISGAASPPFPPPASAARQSAGALPGAQIRDLEAQARHIGEQRSRFRRSGAGRDDIRQSGREMPERQRHGVGWAALLVGRALSTGDHRSEPEHPRLECRGGQRFGRSLVGVDRGEVDDERLATGARERLLREESRVARRAGDQHDGRDRAPGTQPLGDGLEMDARRRRIGGVGQAGLLGAGPRDRGAPFVGIWQAAQPVRDRRRGAQRSLGAGRVRMRGSLQEPRREELRRRQKEVAEPRRVALVPRQQAERDPRWATAARPRR